jgi:hypothetical protein
MYPQLPLLLLLLLLLRLQAGVKHAIPQG